MQSLTQNPTLPVMSLNDIRSGFSSSNPCLVLYSLFSAACLPDSLSSPEAVFLRDTSRSYLMSFSKPFLSLCRSARFHPAFVYEECLRIKLRGWSGIVSSHFQRSLSKGIGV